MKHYIRQEKVESGQQDALFRLSRLATELVREYYAPMMGEEQNAYMIEKYQSVKEISRQLQAGALSYIIKNEKDEEIGFLGFYQREQDVYVSKYYLRAAFRGMGYGRQMMKLVEGYARAMGKNRIELHVNKQNADIAKFEKMGFTRIREEKNSIGNGDYMDDYVYARSIPKITLLAFDLDGTTLTTDKQVTKETLQVLQQAGEMGMTLIPITGRPLEGVPDAIRFLPGIPYLVTSNGAKIYKMPEEREVYQDLLPREKALEVLKVVDPYPIVPDCFIEGKGNMPKKAFELIPKMRLSKEIKAYLLSDSRNFHEDIVDFLGENTEGIEKITLNFMLKPDGTKQQGEQIWNELEQITEISLVVGAVQNFEVSNWTATKGNALKWILEQEQIPVSQVMAVGDQRNDLSMLWEAGFSVAMENAVPEVQEICDWVTGSNDRNGVAEIVKKVLAIS